MADSLLSPRSATASLNMTDVSTRPYRDQAIWMLNGFWADLKDKAERIFEYTQHFVKLDKLGPTKLGADGNELDQFWSAKFLEDMEQAMPALARKEALKKIDQDNNGKMSLLEFLAWKYEKSPKEVSDAPQGSNQEALERAQKKMEEVQKALAIVQKALEDLAAEKEKLKILEAELTAAVAALQAEEDAYNSKIKELEHKANDPTSPRGVAKSRAANELAQLKAEDPLPLRRAKITQEAALRKVKKQKKAVEEAIKVTETKQELLLKEMDEAQEAIKKAQQSGGGGKGALWMMQRELFEADQYLPTNKQKFNHKKPFHYDP